MTADILVLFIVIGGMAVLFITDKMSADLVALTGLMLLVLLGYLTPDQAFSGFSSSVVLTIIPMFMLGAGLRKTGLTDVIGNLVSSFSGKSETVSMAVVMLMGAFISSFMNNVAAAALLMPTVVSIAQKTSNSPSRLLMPLSFAVLLGGNTTLIGTAPNIVSSEILQDQTGIKMTFFDFTFFGVVIAVTGIAYMIFIGRHLLPNHVHLLKKGKTSLLTLYHLKDYLFAMRVPRGSEISGRSLESLHFGESLGVNVVSITHLGQKLYSPGPADKIYAGDTLVISGVKSDLMELIRFKDLKINNYDHLQFGHLLNNKSLKLPEKANGKTIRDFDLLARFHILVVAVERGDRVLNKNLASEKLQAGDILHLIISEHSDFQGFVTETGAVEVSINSGSGFFERLNSRTTFIEIPSGSTISGLTIKESRMQELTGLTVVAVMRGEELIVISDSTLQLAENDRLLAVGESSKIEYLSALGQLEILSNEDSLRSFESEEAGLMEVVLAPRSQLISKTVSELSFREKYNMNVIALWREGKAVLKNLTNTQFRFGDALLLYGLKSRMPVFSKDTDFVVLSENTSLVFNRRKAFFAVFSIFLLIILTAVNLFSLEVSAWLSVVVLVLSGAITMDEGYREIDWRLVILVAALLPLSHVFENMNLSSELNTYLNGRYADYGPYAAIFAVGIMTSLVSQLLEGALAVIFFVPLAISISAKYMIDPKLCVLFTVISASNAFLTPFSHRAHLLVMGAGAYKWKDYFKVGFPFTLLMQLLLFTMFYYSSL